MTGPRGETPSSGWELLDSGGARKLERFGNRVLDRPCPQATWGRSRARRWENPDARFDRDGGWSGPTVGDPEWRIRLDELEFHLALAPSGQVGLFPEHRACWSRLGRSLGPGDRLLNLFAHTGGASLVAARTGASVCHVDASRPAVARARDNAAASGLGDAPIRWIVDDVSKFLAREIRRGNRYEAVLLDPPAFGRGPRGERWSLQAVLDATLEQAFALLSDRPKLVVLSAHTEGLHQHELASRLKSAANVAGVLASGDLWLAGDDAVRPVPSGSWAEWSPAGR